MNETNPLDLYLPEALRLRLEQTYYEPIHERATVEYLVANGRDFVIENPVALYSDHGVVHIRDVAARIVEVLDFINGVLIPRRSTRDLDMFMKGYGVLLAYLHDIGMRDFTRFARSMHAELASQFIFSSDFDSIVQEIWSENYGNLAWRLLLLSRQNELGGPPELVLRELMALCVCHSKSKVPAALLNQPARLRSVMQQVLGADLQSQYALQQEDGERHSVPASIAGSRRAVLERYYADFEKDSFAWMLSDAPGNRRLFQDAIDTLRALRCADALRQRGTVQKTSGGYEVFVSQKTGHALFSLRLADGRLYLMELDLPVASLSAGEANLAGSGLTREGDLRVAFHRGSFSELDATERAAGSAAAVLNDIYSDVIGSFVISDEGLAPDELPRPTRGAEEINILLENTDDNPAFVLEVIRQLKALNPAAAARCCVVPTVQDSTYLESTRYLNTSDIDWDLDRRMALLEKVRASGHKIDRMDIDHAFQHVRQVTLEAGDVLIEAGTPSGFVYLPLGDGLQIIPLGGYQSFSIQGWFPVGSTGVIRGAMRNARVVAGQKIAVLIIPKEVYLQHWFWPYTFDEIHALLRGEQIRTG